MKKNNTNCSQKLSDKKDPKIVFISSMIKQNEISCSYYSKQIDCNKKKAEMYAVKIEDASHTKDLTCSSTIMIYENDYKTYQKYVEDDLKNLEKKRNKILMLKEILTDVELAISVRKSQCEVI